MRSLWIVVLREGYKLPELWADELSERDVDASGDLPDLQHRVWRSVPRLRSLSWSLDVSRRTAKANHQ